MENIITSLWENEELPIKDALYFSSGKSISIKINSYPSPSIDIGEFFDFHEFYEENEDEITNIDTIKKIQLKNGFYCCVGEGSYGSEGFIACLDSNKKLVWVIYSESSNTFINVTEYDDCFVLVESNAGFGLNINIEEPERLSIS